MGKKPKSVSLIQVSLVLSLLVAFARTASAYSLFPEQTSLGLDAVGYLHSDSGGPTSYQSTFASQLMGRWNDHRVESWLEWGAQADGLLMASGLGMPNTSVSPYLEAPELYVGTSLKLAPVQGLIGRKLEKWSHLDDQWGLGIWQPRFRWDYIHPELVGLTGAFVRVEQPLFKIVVMVSPIFIPERGVNLSTGGGSFSSDSRWFIPPPSAISVLGKQTPVNYTLMTPDMGNLLMHAGGSMMARVGRDKGAWGSAAFAYKPMNQLLLAFGGKYRLADQPDDFFANALVYPRVVYHELYSAEGGYQNERINAWGSVLLDRPNRDRTPTDWTTQEVRDSVAASAAVDFRVAGPRKRATWINLSYLKQWGGNAPDTGPFAESGSYFDARYPFQSALGFGARSEAFANILASTRVTYDIGHQGAIWSTEVRYSPAHSWLVGVGADLLASERKADPDNADLIGHINANDRIHAGVSYVF